MRNNKIDVIIPAYNVEGTNLFKCLASVACQSIVEDIDVTIVDDSSEKENYASVASVFKNQLNIQIIKTPKNGGCGVARQWGIDHTSNPYFTFLDTDDTLNGAFALEALRTGIEDPSHFYTVCVGCFDEMQYIEGHGTIALPHDKDFVWMHGKLYRRSYIEEQNIRFHETSRANEDGGFNTMIKLLADDDHQVKFIKARVYYWQENKQSITRSNDNSYAYGTSKKDSFYGYAENQIYAIKEIYRRQPNNVNLIPYAIEVMVNLYIYFIDVLAHAPKNAAQNFEWCKWYYQEIYSKIPEVPMEILGRIYSTEMQGAYARGTFNNFIIPLTFMDFLELLEK